MLEHIYHAVIVLYGMLQKRAFYITINLSTQTISSAFRSRAYYEYIIVSDSRNIIFLHFKCLQIKYRISRNLLLLPNSYTQYPSNFIDKSNLSPQTLLSFKHYSC